MKSVSALALAAALMLLAPVGARGQMVGPNPDVTGSTEMHDASNFSTPSPERLAAAYGEGERAMSAKDWKTAKQKFAYVTSYAPDSLNGWSNLGYSQQMLGDTSKAENSYKKALKLDPHHLATNFRYGEMLLTLNRRDDAQKRLTELQVCCSADTETAQLAADLAAPPASGAPAAKP